MNQLQGNYDDDDNDNDGKQDYKPTAQERRQPEDIQVATVFEDSSEDVPTKKKQKKQPFSLRYEILHQHIKLYSDSRSHIDIRRLNNEVQEAHQ